MQVSFLALCALSPASHYVRQTSTLSHGRRQALIGAAVLLSHPIATTAAESFDKAACLAQYGSSGATLCDAKEKTAEAAARNEARIARLAQCNSELEAVEQNGGVLPASVKPATGDPTTPATCVGAPTYQLTGFGDPSLPRIYPSSR